MTDEEVFVPKKKLVKFAGKEYEIGPFTVGQFMGLSKTLTSMAGRVLSNFSVVYPDKDLSKAELKDIAPLLLGEVDLLADVVGVVIGKDKKWVEKQNDVVGFSNLFTAICEANDFRRIIANFTEGVMALKKQVQEVEANAESEVPST